MATLHRIPVMQGDTPQKATNLVKCEWCNKALKPRIEAINTLALIAFAADTQWQSPTFEDHHPGISFESDILFK